MLIPVVLGTARADRQSDKVAAAAVSIINDLDGCSTELVDVKEHVTEAVTVPPWGAGGADESPTAWSELAKKADAFVLVVPEYNHGYPGELKLLLDSLWDHYQGKPVGIIGVSAGILGGARVIDHIKPVLIEMKMHPIREAVSVLKVKEAFTEDGALTNEHTKKAITTMATELKAFAEQMQK